jgi:hypothetical protein
MTTDVQKTSLQARARGGVKLMGDFSGWSSANKIARAVYRKSINEFLIPAIRDWRPHMTSLKLCNQLPARSDPCGLRLALIAAEKSPTKGSPAIAGTTA